MHQRAARQARLVIGAAIVALAVGVVFPARWLTRDTTLEFVVEDSVTGHWVWDARIGLQNRLQYGFFQSDAGPLPLRFTHLQQGESTLQISARGYESVSLPVKLRRGANRLEEPVVMLAYEIPELDHFVLFETVGQDDVTVEIRPVGTDGTALTNHPPIPLGILCLISVQTYGGAPAAEETDSGSAHGDMLFGGRLDVRYDTTPETLFRYSSTIRGSEIRLDPSPLRVYDYLIVVPDPRKIGDHGINEILDRAARLGDMEKIAALLDTEKGRLRYFFDTSWNVKARKE